MDWTTANIAAIGQFRGTLEDIRELNSLYRKGMVPPHFMLTSSYHIKPATITGTGGIAAIEDSVIPPAVALRDSGMVVTTNFSALISTWQIAFNSRGYIYDARNPSAVKLDATPPHESFLLEQNYPNPFNPTTTIAYVLGLRSSVNLKVLDILGREVSTLVNEEKQPGTYTVRWDASGMASGVYLYRLQAGRYSSTRKLVLMK